MNQLFSATAYLNRECRFGSAPMALATETFDLSDVAAVIQESLDYHLEYAGWKSGSCPECAEKHKDALTAEASADVFRDLE